MAEHGRIGTYTNHKCRCDKCREAWRQWNRDYHRRRPEVGRRKARRRYAERKEFALAYMGGKCQECGLLENLEFHHVDPDSKFSSISTMLSYAEPRLVTELDKCRLLCRACHWVETRANGRVGRRRKPPSHGTTTLYKSGCRCEECKRAMSEENRRYYLARKERLTNT